MVPTPHQLDYAPAVPRYHRWKKLALLMIFPIRLLLATPARRKWTKRGAFLMLDVALIVGGCRWGPPLWRQLQIPYWQRACMQYAPAADTVVYEEATRAAADLLASGSQYKPYPMSRSDSLSISPDNARAAAMHPHCLTKLESVNGPVDGSDPAIDDLMANGTEAVLFLHGRRSPSGHARLIVVTYYPLVDIFSPSFTAADCNAQSAIPATTSTRAHLARDDPSPGYSTFVDAHRCSHPPVVRVYAGQPDPIDSAHFTIRYQMWGQEDVLDGRLSDDDSVTLTPRHTPTEPRRSSPVRGRGPACTCGASFAKQVVRTSFQPKPGGREFHGARCSPHCSPAFRPGLNGR